MTTRPVEWEIRLPLTGEVVAIIRAVELGRRRETYYRVVTANPDRAQRMLVGYWGSVEDAHNGALALYEHGTRRSIAGGGLPPSMPFVPQKPPPDPGPPAGVAARPRQHATRA